MEYLSQAALDLLVENRLNDSKPFYDEHKPQIEALVREPIFKIIEEVVPVLQKMDPEIILAPKRQISRIRRDTRFTNDKSLYRANVWCWLGRDKREWDNYPRFFFEVTPGYVWWGCGLYFAEPAMFDSYREMILSRDPVFMEAKESLEGQRRFKIETDDMFKRTKYPNEPQDIRVWLDRKSIYVSHTEEDVSIAFSDKLVKALKRDFPKLKAYYKFLTTAYDRRQTPETLRPWSPHKSLPEDEW